MARRPKCRFVFRSCDLKPRLMLAHGQQPASSTVMSLDAATNERSAGYQPSPGRSRAHMTQRLRLTESACRIESCASRWKGHTGRLHALWGLHAARPKAQGHPQPPGPLPHHQRERNCENFRCIRYARRRMNVGVDEKVAALPALGDRRASDRPGMAPSLLLEGQAIRSPSNRPQV